eukprot:TRINITY_DN54046_c0_g1_i1.p1 TRINITY_DN54046_c0_g1~~TRINITY_DN54046_c0_g1_i1.p1  ORF type:complete len:379 (+),score=113.99 TRINITY_DN54046_c0_g1_i1:83-1219(+)
MEEASAAATPASARATGSGDSENAAAPTASGEGQPWLWDDFHVGLGLEEFEEAEGEPVNEAASAAPAPEELEASAEAPASAEVAAAAEVVAEVAAADSGAFDPDDLLLAAAGDDDAEGDWAPGPEGEDEEANEALANAYAGFLDDLGPAEDDGTAPAWMTSAAGVRRRLTHVTDLFERTERREALAAAQVVSADAAAASSPAARARDLGREEEEAEDFPDDSSAAADADCAGDLLALPVEAPPIDWVEEEEPGAGDTAALESIDVADSEDEAPSAVAGDGSSTLEAGCLPKQGRMLQPRPKRKAASAAAVAAAVASADLSSLRAMYLELLERSAKERKALDETLAEIRHLESSLGLTSERKSEAALDAQPLKRPRFFY